MAQVPFQDSAGQWIRDLNDWTRSRKQQMNFETVLQLVSLRAQPTIVTDPKEQDGIWKFEFSVETMGVYSANGSDQDTSALLSECEGTPMIIGLRETKTNLGCLSIESPHQNIWFETINI